MQPIAGTDTGREIPARRIHFAACDRNDIGGRLVASADACPAGTAGRLDISAADQDRASGFARAGTDAGRPVAALDGYRTRASGDCKGRLVADAYATSQSAFARKPSSEPEPEIVNGPDCSSKAILALRSKVHPSPER